MGCGTTAKARLVDFYNRNINRANLMRHDEWVWRLVMNGAELENCKIRITCKTKEDLDCPDSFASIVASSETLTGSDNNGTITLTVNEPTQIEAKIRIPNAGKGLLIDKNQLLLYFDVQITRDTSSGTPDAPIVETVLWGEFYLIPDISQTSP